MIFLFFLIEKKRKYFSEIFINLSEPDLIILFRVRIAEWLTTFSKEPLCYKSIKIFTIIVAFKIFFFELIRLFTPFFVLWFTLFFDNKAAISILKDWFDTSYLSIQSAVYLNLCFIYN
ncbi:hypothetical protein BpHYR1_010557 [Brachionus plicatilis]|uniref:Uncharacterized protein n=1 Tax=Brachionus plicatilis TaxID=10195 RepID=A0A3M7T8X8_BRAPC|nr:hypothetical protein BpHYR1_010557 [Brachionus plicatilis]